MNASRSRREPTSETSIFDTNRKCLLRRISPLLGNFQQRFSHVFLASNQIDEQQIKRDEIEPEIANRLADEQQRKQNQHPSSRHQETPPFQRRTRQVPR